MSDQPSILDVMADLMASLPKPVRRELHVSAHVRLFLRETFATEAVTAMLAVPVVVDADLTGGEWEIRENGEVTTFGDMAPAPDGMLVFYTPLSGWLAIRKDLAPVPAGFSWTTL